MSDREIKSAEQAIRDYYQALINFENSEQAAMLEELLGEEIAAEWAEAQATKKSVIFVLATDAGIEL